MNTFYFFLCFNNGFLCIYNLYSYLCITFRNGISFTKRKDSVAQLVEQYTFNVWVLGSNPSGITKKASQKCEAFFCAIWIRKEEQAWGRFWEAQGA